MIDFETRLVAIEQRIDAMAEFIHALSSSMEQPVFNRSERYFRYSNPSAMHFVLLKGTRVVSAFYACTTLCRGGFAQEIYVLLRTVIEYCSQIDYMASSLDGTQRPSGRAADIVRDYFEDHYESRSVSAKRLKLKQQDVHEHVASFIDQSLAVEHRSVPLSKLMSNIYINLSNFVHGRHVECMDLYGGTPGHFHLFGMSGTPKDAENIEILETYLITAEHCLVGAIQAFRLFPILGENAVLQDWYDSVLNRISE
ncbi:hypothetical protein [Tardiphaga sp. 768_D3_N2_1]|uniref:hypothetical protein n=1 Tax=Tardiphaga sp. 768_D3_N2_1 TaxID=3240783 RepID=UPI003F8BCFA7